MSGDSAKDEIDDVREALGRRVREVWIAWAKTQPEPKPSWLVPWEEMEEKDREVDRQIGETIAEEAQVDLLKENEGLQMDLARLRDLRMREVESLSTMRRRAEKAESRPNVVAWISLGTGFGALLLLGWVFWHIPEPVVCPPPPEPVVCPPPVVCESEETPTQADGDELGYWVGDGIEGRRHPWPDASNYPAARFETDCHDVCAVPEGYTSHPTPGRVLVMDPAHLVCVCLHPDSHGSAWSVARWIGWERVR